MDEISWGLFPKPRHPVTEYFRFPECLEEIESGVSDAVSQVTKCVFLVEQLFLSRIEWT